MRDGEIDALQRALHEVDDLAHQPVRLVRDERPVDRQHRVAIAFGADHDGADLRLVDPQPQQRVVELAERAQRPELIAGLRGSPSGVDGCGPVGACTVRSAVRLSRLIVSVTAEYVSDDVGDRRVERVQRDARVRSPDDRTSPPARARASAPPP